MRQPLAPIQPTIMKQYILGATNHPLFPILVSFWGWRKLWIGSAALFTVIGLLYALALKTDTWVATQGLIVRDEATGTVMRLGRFESQTQMKAAQELVLEIASSPQVVGKALATVGRPAKFFGLLPGDSAFSPAEIESFGRSCVSVRAPRGAELGTTEVIYLEVKQKSKERAVLLAAAICDALEAQLQEVRQARADGVIRELQAAFSVSETELQRSTEKLKNIELEAGADLVDLRGLTDSNSGSTNRLMLDMVRDDRRKCEFELQLHRENLEATQAALQNPELLMQITDRLLESQPTIKKLREGLSDARLRTAQLQGRFSESHPDVLIAKTTEQRFRDNLLRELASSELAILGAIELCENKIAKLNDQENELGKRLNLLADIRADYTNVVSEVKATNEELQQIKRELTQAMAARNAASTSSLITRIDQPLLGDRPVGPGRTTIVGGAMVGGLFFGLGIAFLLTPLNAPPFNSAPYHHTTSGEGSSGEVPQTTLASASQPATQAVYSPSEQRADRGIDQRLSQEPAEGVASQAGTQQRLDLEKTAEKIETAGANSLTETNSNLTTAISELEANLRTGLGPFGSPASSGLLEKIASKTAAANQPATQGRQVHKSATKPAGLEDVQAMIAKMVECSRTQGQA